jgi:beta-fructofuranosidase
VFTESPGTRKTIGDVDVLFHEGVYHLFHLVLPNHDFIAHAISDNGLNWRRIDNAIFIGHPGSWDDLMLWTVHVTPHPHRPGWRMFYTGLSRRDHGLKQRIGLAESEDLYTWRKAAVHWEDHRGAKDPEAIKAERRKLPRGLSDAIHSAYDAQSVFPIEPDPVFYEADVQGARRWVSFRDPFYFADQDRGWLLAAARINEGPLVRRGCVACMEETAPNIFTAGPALHAPRLYDDIEVPNLLKLDGEYYLIGSLREDAKIRYWHTDELGKPWRNYYDNVLLPQGNYAGRVCRDDSGLLLWNFFTEHLGDRTCDNLMPPPKRLARAANGQLQATTFEQFDRRELDQLDIERVRPLLELQAHEFCEVEAGVLRLASQAGFQACVFEQPMDCFSMTAFLTMQGIGKCGIVSRVDPQTHDGYYFSLDLMKGIAQMRAWGTGPLHSGEQMMRFKTLQAGYWYDGGPRDVTIRLLAFGSYHELSINGSVVLSLSDTSFEQGLLGFYVETADLRIERLRISRLAAPTQSDAHLANG